MNYFKKINLYGGWGVFLISAIIYTLSMEPTASLWDCSEFIATSYKLEVGHPPGAPLFMMINRLFSMFAPDTTAVARMVNFASVIASALTIAFLFWTIANLGMRIMQKKMDTLTKNEAWLTFIAAFIGSMAYAFTDTFWFSAIEGEVYAQSSLFTALVYWAMLKWENEADSPHSTRWIVLVAYLMGLSIGVHLLNLLAIPALVLVFYYRKVENKSRWGWWKAFGLSVIILAFILFGIIPSIPAIGAWFDRIAVNGMGMPVNSGFIIFFALLIAALGYGIYYTHIKGHSILNTAILCVTVIIIGYSTYASVVIRAMANPPMNSNAPSDPYQLLSFLNRDQYGSKPLLNGNYYSSPMIDMKEKTMYYYNSEEKKYNEHKTVDMSSIKYAQGTTTFFPRMHSEAHADQYRSWVDIKGKNVQLPNGKSVNVPTFAENLSFFFNYQVRYMYWRYFLWNFVGRQNDEQGDGGILYGNWLSGIPFIDRMYLENIDNIPDQLLENKGRNTYFFLPFLLGLGGLFWQLRRDKNNFNVVMFLFLMTGLAIILYLNQTPGQPRERDYAYAGSFYAFSIWIGLGVFWVYGMMQKLKALKSDRAKIAIATVLSLSVPVILLAENWDDHTRAGRYIARDMGSNYLESTLPNSIILPYGDNDTFPLWYNQEVEGVRTDVKISNLSYLASDWYTDQMKERTNEAAPVNFTIPKSVYYKKNESIPIVELKEGYLTIQQVLEFVKDNSQAKRNALKNMFESEVTEIIPTRRIAIPVNKENALKSGIVAEKDAHLMVDTIYIELKGNSLNRSEYMILDMIGSADWSRPIYVTQPQGGLAKFGLDKYLQQDGLAYRLVPIRTDGEYSNIGRIDSENLYNNLMNKFKYGNISDPTVNVDYFVRYTISASQLRFTFARLAKQLINEGDTVRAKKVIEKAMEEIPHYQIPYDMASERLVETMYMSGMTEEGDRLMDELIDYHLSNMEYYYGFGERYFGQLRRDMQSTVYSLYNIYALGMNYGKEEKVKDLKRFSDMLK